MKKILLLLFLILCSYSVYSFETRREFYYNNGSTFLVDGINDSDISLDGNIPSLDDLIYIHGWKTTGDKLNYTDEYSYVGLYSIYSAGDKKAYIVVNNASFDGSFGIMIYDDGDAEEDETYRIFAFDGVSTGGVQINSGLWGYTTGGSVTNCDLNTISRKSNDWTRVYFSYNLTTTNVTIYVENKSCHKFTGFNGLSEVRTFSSIGDDYYFDDVWIYGGEKRPEGEASTPPPINIKNLTLKLKDENYNDLDIYNLNESSYFFVYGNYTQDNIPITNDNICNFTAHNVTANFNLKNYTSNITLSDTNKILSLSFNENNANLINDYYKFKICRGSVPTNLNIILNGNIIDTVSSSIIPLCSIGTHTEENLTTSGNGLSNLNLTLKCSNCEGLPNSYIKIINDNNNLLIYQREYNKHSEYLTYNSTLTFHQFTEHLYNFKEIGIGKANLTLYCNNTIKQNILDIGNANLSIDILSINNLNYSDGLQIESSLTTNITIDIYDDVVSEIIFNVSYSNGTLIKTSNAEFMQLTNNELNVNGQYNITIKVTDDDNISIYKNGYFNLNDTITPLISWINPLNNNLSEFTANETITFSLYGYDINLFSLRADFYYPNGTLAYNFSELNILGSNYTLENNIKLTVAGNWTAKGNATDSHTDNILNNLEVLKGDNNLTYNNIKIVSPNAIKTNTIKLKDRYTFEFNYEEGIGTRIYYLYTSDNSELYYIKNSEYNAHFVNFKNNLWIDFDGTNLNYEVKKITNSYYTITFYNAKNTLKFNSIGSQNYNIKIIRFLVNPSKPLPEPMTLTDVAHNIYLILLFSLFVFIQLFILSLGFKYELFGVSISSCIMGILISIAFIKFITLNVLFKNTALIYLLINILLIWLISNRQN